MNQVSFHSGPFLVLWNLHRSHFLQEILYAQPSQHTLESLAGFSSPIHHEPTRWTDGILLSDMFYRSNGKPLPSLQCTIAEVGEKTNYTDTTEGILACLRWGPARDYSVRYELPQVPYLEHQYPNKTILNFAWSVMQSTPIKTEHKNTPKANTSTSRCLTTKHSERNRAGKSNLIHRTFDLAPQVLDNRNISRQ